MWQWKREEAWGTGILMLISMGGYAGGLTSADTPQVNASTFSNPSSKIIVGLFVLAALLPVFVSFRSVLQRMFALFPLVPYLAIAVASIMWSQDAEPSLRRVISLLATTLFGLYFAVRFPQRTQVRMLLAATSILAVATVLLALLAPQYATDHETHTGAWRGVFSQKNACAMVMVVGLAAALVYQPNSIVTRVWKFASLILFSVIVIKADSSGALLLMLGLVVLVQILRWLTRFEVHTRTLLCWLLVIFSCLTSFLAMQFVPEILKLLNRDPTLTGRTALWAQVWKSILERPFLGYGYGAFWNGLAGPSERIVLALGWTPPHAHNGFLDIWLCLGGLGLAAFCYALLQCAWRIGRLIGSHELRLNLWLVIPLVLILLYNLDESVLIASPSLMWVLFVSSVCGLELYAHRSSPARPVRRSFAQAQPVPRQVHKPVTLLG